MSKKRKVSADLQGVTRLVTDATIGITNLVEAMHKRIVHPPLLPSTPIQHLITKIAGFAYKNIRWSTRLIGSGVDKALEQLTPILGEIKATGEREAIRAVLNGVLGDHLENNENPLKVTMEFKHHGKTIILDRDNLKKEYPKINGKILLMIHGSCMNDIQWTGKGHNHGAILAKELNKTPLYLNYNSGLHISTNGQKLNILLEELMNQWPVPIEELTIIAHSMGGLVTRSAIYYGQQQEKLWITPLKKIVFLGTPHHGAPLEKLGNYLDMILEAIPYAKPFARLGKIRSAGVTDLRYGNLIDEDWQHDEDRFRTKGDQRLHVPLPEQIACYSIAGMAGKKKASVSTTLFGDNMVTVKSALGQHTNPVKSLHFKKENTWVAYEHNHVDLLSSTKVYTKIKGWLV
jgi:pimeloyl-ACP methyl ester carboxylesterase